jgi:hypothetical protein
MIPRMLPAIALLLLLLLRCRVERRRSQRRRCVCLCLKCEKKMSARGCTCRAGCQLLEKTTHHQVVHTSSRIAKRALGDPLHQSKQRCNDDTDAVWPHARVNAITAIVIIRPAWTLHLVFRCSTPRTTNHHRVGMTECHRASLPRRSTPPHDTPYVPKDIKANEPGPSPTVDVQSRVGRHTSCPRWHCEAPRCLVRVVLPTSLLACS